MFHEDQWSLFLACACLVVPEGPVSFTLPLALRGRSVRGDLWLSPGHWASSSEVPKNQGYVHSALGECSDYLTYSSTEGYRGCGIVVHLLIVYFVSQYLG